MSWPQVGQMLRRSPGRVIAVLGFTEAGKSCLLTSYFLQIANGQRVGFPYRFASSRTLFGWRDLINRANQWQGRKDEQILPHTPTAEGDQPARLLHLGLRPTDPADERHIDVLFSDIPGEWILDWTERDTPEHRQRVEFLQCTQAALVLIDAPAMLGEDGSQYAFDTALLIRRLADFASESPTRMLRAVILVLSKFDEMPADIQVPAGQAERLDVGSWDERLAGPLVGVLSALQELADRGIATEVYPVSAFPHPLAQGQPVGVMVPFASAMRCADVRSKRRLSAPIPGGGGPAHAFLAMRRWEDGP